ncbi:tRNA (cytosine(34)-C(5))-methyltransferase, mitochondrial [Corythoichthys intestinalis]|uniref:tRNA (cytosine(34)-C(5))-methyltransferase, mitochondrial n=1 Tax=Corythoichthys intestinalis TaxID=161448 RepID=UPI0025A5B9AC|nr:tRNA (cytosine(34)-C(5))-methyltransferase, mitochondrial [Corythoichthys intestinalis]XP_057708123.1 tRNA (cytosine(34)-C(5))-methyltransferase, mitochondrial [Corythoichthys intestinalis]XP_061796110.1 tRNA (cytosine(34)-C(5))-methyltransferase, mitochondrial-like [Nerophis lumbriciformis]
MFEISLFLRRTFNRSGKLTPRLVCSPAGYTSNDGVQKHKKPKRASFPKVIRTSKKERSSCQFILDHFDLQYSEELGDLWTTVRSVLLDPQSWQYGVLLNRFTVVTDIKRVLLSQGFSTLLPQKEALTLSGVLRTVFNAECQTSEEPLLERLGDNSLFLPDNSSGSPIQQAQSEPCLGPLSSSLQCYIHPYPLRFPSQAHRPGQLKQYYLLNAASVLPVLALQVRDGEKVLDLCSAPGGKAFAIMQCAAPAFLCCNEPDAHRRDRLAKTLESFLPHSLSSKVVVTDQDGRSFGQSQPGIYDKVLVDAPCSNDRSWLFSSAGQQVEQRLKERGKLPQLQVQLLRSALSAVRPGGTVVYSTCTMSSSENFAVVEAVLKECPEAEPEDLWEEIALPLSNYFTFSPAHHVSGLLPNTQSLQPQCDGMSLYDSSLGILVVPQPYKTWGPMFLSRIRKKN